VEKERTSIQLSVCVEGKEQKEKGFLGGKREEGIERVLFPFRERLGKGDQYGEVVKGKSSVSD